MLSISQHISHPQLFTGGAVAAGINRFVTDTLEMNLLSYLPLDFLTIALSPFHPSEHLKRLISWITISLWSRLPQSATFSFLLHTFLLLRCYLITATQIGSFVLETVQMNGKRWVQVSRSSQMWSSRFTQQAGDRARSNSSISEL